MGYESYVTGEGSIKPAIDDPHLKRHDVNEGDGYFVFQQHEGDEDVQLVNGKLVVVGTSPAWTAVDFGYEDSGKFYELESATHDLANTVAKLGSKLNLHLRITGEEQGDIWRIRVVDNVIQCERPKLVWPNGDEEQL